MTKEKYWLVKTTDLSNGISAAIKHGLCLMEPNKVVTTNLRLKWYISSPHTADAYFRRQIMKNGGRGGGSHLAR